MQEIARNIAYVSIFTNVLPLAVAAWRWRRLSASQRVLSYLLVLGLLTQITTFCLGLWQLNNYFLFHIYIPVELGFYGWIFYRERLFFARKSLLISIWSAMLVFAIVNAISLDGWRNMPSSTFLAEGSLVTLAGVLYFWQVFREMKVWRVEQESLFWVCISAWVYFLGGMLIILFDGLLQTAQADTYFLVWGIHSSLVLLTGILFAIALSCKNPIQKS